MVCFIDGRPFKSGYRRYKIKTVAGNGGVIDPRVVLVRDSLVGMAMVLQLMAQTGKPLSELVRQIPSYVMVKTKFPCPPEAVADILRAARGVFAARPEATFNDADGLRVDLPEGWLCVRASNTEPIARILAEARNQAEVQALVQPVRAAAEAALKST
jgi:phosphomannomutase